MERLYIDLSRRLLSLSARCAMYDESVASRRDRSAIEPGKAGRCTHCAHAQLFTASLYEWPCLILQDWICETHCAEVNLSKVDDTRAAVAKQVGWQQVPGDLLRVCDRCPYKGQRIEGAEAI